MTHGTGSPAEPLRLGVLGAARISELALVGPARATGARLVAVAARDPRRAEEFAARSGVERVVASYDDLVADPEVEAVYNPLANALHGPWNLAAVAARKHVLTEKPSASNAEEAVAVRDAAAAAGVTVLEGFHYLFHPVLRRLHALLDGGDLGDLREVEVRMTMPAPADDDPRWSFELAGGALMDLGCYALHAARGLAPWTGGEPRVVAARAGERAGRPGVDEWLDADLATPSGVPVRTRTSMAADRWDFSLRLVGARGEAFAPEFVRPHLDDRVVVRAAGAERVERLGTRSSYTYQLEAFTAHLRHGAPLPLDADDAVASMRLVDAVYAAAGLPPRPALPPVVRADRG